MVVYDKFVSELTQARKNSLNAKKRLDDAMNSALLRGKAFDELVIEHEIFTALLGTNESLSVEVRENEEQLKLFFRCHASRMEKLKGNILGLYQDPHEVKRMLEVFGRLSYIFDNLAR